MRSVRIPETAPTAKDSRNPDLIRNIGCSCSTVRFMGATCQNYASMSVAAWGSR
jgi:hypothetical protein